MSLITVVLLGLGVLLIYSAVKGVNPVEVVKQALGRKS